MHYPQSPSSPYTLPRHVDDPKGGQILFSVERNTVRLERDQSHDHPDVQEKVAREIEQAAAFLKEGVPISITCYVGGVKCTKQAEMMRALLAMDSGYARLITPHLTCNYSIADTQAYLSELHSHGVTNILIVSGDKLEFKDFKREPGLRQARDLVALARSTERRLSIAGDLVEEAVKPFDIAVAYSSFKGATAATEQRKLEQKLAAGATSVKTQPLTYADSQLIERDLMFLSERFPLENIGFSVILYQSPGMVRNMRKSPYSIPIADCIEKRLSEAAKAGEADGRSKHHVFQEGICIAAQSIAYLITQGVRSINLMAVRKPETYRQILALVPTYLDQYRTRSSLPMILSRSPFLPSTGIAAEAK